MKKKLSILFMFSFCLFISMSLIIESQASSTLEKTNLGNNKVRIQTKLAEPVVDIELLENTDTCFIDCHAILKFHSYADIKLPSSANSEFRWDFIKEKSYMKGLESYKFEVLTNVSYDVSVPIYENKSYESVCNNPDNTTYGCTKWRLEQTGSKIETKYREEFKPFVFWGSTLESGRDYVIRLSGKKQAAIGDNDIDWIPTIKGIEIGEWAWWNTSWQKCMNITITNAGSSTLANFPAYINLSYDLDMLNDYSDLRFVSSGCNEDGSLMPHEIENYTADRALIWIAIPSIPASGTNISVYYKNKTNVKSAENVTGVWDRNYVFVHHFEENDIDSGSGDIKDSTRYMNNCTTSGMTTGAIDDGMVGNGFYFDGVNDQLSCGSDASLDIETDELTIESWLWSSGTALPSNRGEIVEKGYNKDDLGYTLMMSEGKGYFGKTDVQFLGTDYVPLNNSQWHFLVGNKNASNHFNVYLEGILNTSAAGQADFDDSGRSLLIGRRSYGTPAIWYMGTLDEIRISNITRSADWINQTYQMVMNQEDFVDFGEEIETIISITIESPANASYSSLPINLNVTLDGIGNTCLWNLDGGTNNTMSGSGMEWYDEITGISQATHQLEVWCNGSSGIMVLNNSIYFTYDATAPAWSNILVNNSAPRLADIVQFNVSWTDNIGLSSYIFSWNDSGEWVNASGSLSGTYRNISIEKTVTSTRGDTIGWKFYANDIADNWNETPIQNNNVANTPPTHSKPALTSTYGTNYTGENLTCYNQSSYDADSDQVTNIYNWLINDQPMTVLNIPFEGGSSDNYTKDYSGYGNDGNVSGAVWNQASGIIGGAYEFDGSNDYIKVINNFGTSFNVFSAEAWVNLKNIGTQFRYILERGDTHFYVAIKPDRKIIFRHVDLTNGATETGPNATEFNEWTHVAVVYDGTKTHIYVNGNLEKEQADTGTISFSPSHPLYIGSSQYAPSYPDRTWNGTIDEVKIYSHALTPEQILQNYLDTKDGFTNNRTIASEQTTPGETYKCGVTPNDGYDDGVAKGSDDLTILWNITFNIYSGEDGSQLANVDISCNNTWSVTGVNSPYEHGFLPGDYECTFEEPFHFNKTIIFTADNDTIIDVVMSESGKLTIEEHTWLEKLYNCLYLGEDNSCAALKLLLNINETVTDIWTQFKRTDETVVLFENVTNYNVTETSNLTIDYSIYVPSKKGYSPGEYLPIRISYWFTAEDNSTCYDQGDKPTGVESPYCQPLIIQTLGPMEGTVNFTVVMRPELPAGDYNITRRIDIDPDDVWINYGQEVIGEVHLSEANMDSRVNLQGGITGLVISPGISLEYVSIMISLLILILVGFVFFQSKKKI